MKLLIIWVLLIALLLSGGCGIARDIFGGNSNNHIQKPDVQPPGLNGDLHKLLIMGIVFLGIGVAAYVVIPGDHKLAIGIMAGAGAVGGVALFLQIALPLIILLVKISVISLLVVGLLLVGLKLYKNKRLEKLIRETT